MIMTMMVITLPATTVPDCLTLIMVLEVIIIWLSIFSPSLSSSLSWTVNGSEGYDWSLLFHHLNHNNHYQNYFLRHYHHHHLSVSTLKIRSPVLAMALTLPWKGKFRRWVWFCPERGNFGNGFNFALKINFALKKDGKSLKSREVHSLEVQCRIQDVSLALSSSSLRSLHLFTLASL